MITKIKNFFRLLDKLPSILLLLEEFVKLFETLKREVEELVDEFRKEQGKTNSKTKK